VDLNQFPIAAYREAYEKTLEKRKLALLEQQRDQDKNETEEEEEEEEEEASSDDEPITTTTTMDDNTSLPSTFKPDPKAKRKKTLSTSIKISK
jgi:cell division protein FtsN